MNTARPVIPMHGGCACGLIRYELTAFPLLLYTCSCTDCQTTSGSAFALNMPVATAAFHIRQGMPKPWRHKSPAGVPVSSWFCVDCGARIYGERENRPNVMNLRAGTLDDTRWLRPAAHLFTASAQPWISLAGSAECHDRDSGDFRRLGARWRSMWPEFFPQK